MLARLFSGPTAETGLGHAVTAVGDPNQAIYGWRGASVSNILGFGATFPALDGPVPVLPLTVNRRSDAPHPRGRQPPRRAAVRRAARRRAARGRRRPRGPGRPRRSSRPPTPSWRGCWRRCARPTTPTRRPGRAWLVRHRRADPRQQHRRGGLRRADRRRDPVEIVGPLGPAAAARGGRGGRGADAAARRDRQPRAAHPADRPALGVGPRDLRLLGERATEIAGRRGRAGRPGLDRPRS